MKKYDFLIIYQIKAREFENCILLKLELERRGYTVQIVNFYRYSQRTKQYNASVVICQADDDWMLSELRFFVKDPKKVMSFKWEQIYSNYGCNRDDTIMAIRGKAQEAITFAWGDISYNRFVNVYGVPSKNIIKTGHITLDFLRPEFLSYFKAKEDICTEFGLDPNRKIFLYISSFAAASLSKEDLESYRNNNNGIDPIKRLEICVESQKTTLEWFSKELEKHPDIQLIYRPHPTEKSNPLLKECSDKYNNFHVISNYSVKQWIVICDKLFSWISTSIGEVFAAKKPCSIVRPIDIPFSQDVEIYKNAKIISTFEDFDKTFDSDAYFESDFPIPIEDMNNYYFIPKDSYTFELQADICEEVFKDDSYIIDDFPIKHKIGKGLIFRLKRVLRRYVGVSFICSLLAQSVLKGHKFADTVRLNHEDHELVKVNVPNRNELSETEQRIQEMLKHRVKRNS